MVERAGLFITLRSAELGTELKRHMFRLVMIRIDSQPSYSFCVLAQVLGRTELKRHECIICYWALCHCLSTVAPHQAGGGGS